MPFQTDDFVLKSFGTNSFTLVRPLIYKGSKEIFLVPAGTRTDFASVPKELTWLFPKYGIYSRAAILHDYFCENPEIVSRHDADGLFRRILRELGVSFPVQWMMWAGVRVGGRLSDISMLEFFQFFIVAILAIPVLAIPIVVVFAWTLLFDLVDLVFRISNVFFSRQRR